MKIRGFHYEGAMDTNDPKVQQLLLGGDELTAVAEREALVSRVDRHSCHFKRHEKLRAKPLRLCHRATRQLTTADTGGKPEVVLNPGAAARLPARRVSVEQQRLEPFRGAVHRGREAGGTGADNHQVVRLLARGNRILLVAAHFGRGELGAVLIRRLLGYPLTVVAMPEPSE